MNDLVTVVTVTYNAEDLLEETLLSVINQSYENIEYIVIDGASTDNTVEIIKKYADKISYWVSEPDEGIYFAMNKAIEKATGKWINFMNAEDTFFDLDTVKYIMEHKDNEAELLYGNFKVKESGITFKARDKTLWHRQMPFCHQTLFTQTTIMREYLFDTNFRLAADHNFIIRMYHNQKKFFHIDRTIAIFSMGGFAQNNELLMDVESIKVFLDNKVPESEIKKSWWYIDLQKKLCSENIQHVNKLEEIIVQKDRMLKEFNLLHSAVRVVTIYSIFKQPFKKYNS